MTDNKSCVVGVDIGSTTVKLVCFDAERSIVGTEQHRVTLRIKSLTAAMIGEMIGGFVSRCGYTLSAVERMVITGVGAGFVEGDIGGIVPQRANELEALARGGLFLSGLQRALVVSLGTGSSFVLAEGEQYRHLGGSAIGAAAVEGLGLLTVGENDALRLSELARGGDLKRIDLIMEDISKDTLSFLPMSATAAHFGKVSRDSAPEDVARAIINLVCQNIALFAVFTGRGVDADEIVLTGGLTAVPQTGYDFEMVGRLYGVKFIIPEHSVYAVAIGACMCYMQ